MAAAEVELKSPCGALSSKGEISPWNSHPSLAKRGRGDFERNDAGIIANV
jgi:hypothetical protein